MIYGYIRVSTKEQNLDRQIKALEDTGYSIDKIFADKASGKNFDRAEYQNLLKTAIKGDLIVIKSIDRLGRNYDDIIEQWKELTDKGIDIEVLDMPLLNTRDRADGLTGAFISNLVLQILSYVAQVERENIKQRQAEGIKTALEKGVKFGRKAADMNKIKECKSLVNDGTSVAKACEMIGISRATYYKFYKIA